jgi:uncharacterized membrane protein YgcG
MNRKAIPKDVQARLLAESRRRCAVCYGLEHDLRVKRGQLAHLDQDSSNSNPENIVFLCFDHHDEYDSTTRQSKKLTHGEILTYHRQLIAELERQWSSGEFSAPPPPPPISVVLNIQNIGGAGGAGGTFGGGGGGGGAASGSGGDGGEASFLRQPGTKA